MPANPEDVQMEQQALYENEALRENLDDDEAEALLKWGEGWIAQLGQAEGDFAQGCQAVRRVLAAADKLVARADLDEETAQKAIQRLAEGAPLLGLSLNAEQVSAALPSDPADRPATLAALLALLSGTTVITTQAVPQPAPAPEADTPDVPQPAPAPEADTPSDDEASPSTPGERLNQVMGRLRDLLGGST